jgi:hypothetical protein
MEQVSMAVLPECGIDRLIPFERIETFLDLSNPESWRDFGYFRKFLA